MNQVDLSSCSSQSFVGTLCDADFCSRVETQKDYGIGQVAKNHRELWTIKQVEDEISEREAVELDHLAMEIEESQAEQDAIGEEYGGI